MKVKQIKRSIMTILMTTVLLTVTSVISVNAETTKDYEYTVENNVATITQYLGDSENVIVPSTIDGYRVEKIANDAFRNNSTVVSVTIENGIISIGDFAFNGCTNLSKVSVPDSLISIAGYSFHKTQWLENQSDGIVYVGNVVYTYKGNISPNTSITIKNGTKSIAFNAFGVDGSENLTDIYFPDSVIYISPLALRGTGWYNQQPDGLVYAGKVLYDYKGEVPEKTKVNVKDGTFGIGGGAFRYCKSSENLISISIPASVKTIGWGAFINCINLNTITIPKNVYYIGDYAIGYIDQGKVAKDYKGDHIIKGYTNTSAHRYAMDYDIKFIALDEKIDYSKYNPIEFIGMSFEEITNIFGDDYTKVEERETGLHKIICYPNTDNPFEFGFDNKTDLVKCVWTYDLSDNPIKLFDDITNKSTLGDIEKSSTSFKYDKWVGENVFNENNVEQYVTYKINNGITVRFEWTSNDFSKQPANRVLVMQSEVEETKGTEPTSTQSTTNKDTTEKVNPTYSTNATSKVSTNDTATNDSINNGTIQTGAVVSIAVSVFLILFSLATGGFAWYKRKNK